MRKRKQVWVDVEFHELIKNSGYPSTIFTKSLAQELKSKRKKYDEEDLFRI